jgi:uncharacterized protein
LKLTIIAGDIMVNPIVHFEIIGKDPKKLQGFYKELFGWEADFHSIAAPEISEKGNYGFVQNAADSGQGIPGGIGGGSTFESHAIFYVGVDDVEAMLVKVESLGGKRVLGPAAKPDGSLVVAQFIDLEGNLVGLAGSR